MRGNQNVAIQQTPHAMYHIPGGERLEQELEETHHADTSAASGELHSFGINTKRRQYQSVLEPKYRRRRLLMVMVLVMVMVMAMVIMMRRMMPMAMMLAMMMMVIA